MNHYSFVRPRWASVLAVCASASFSAITAYLDVVSGPTVRVFPIYFLPVALVAWRFGVRAACWSAVFATTAWELAHRFESGSEHHAGLTSIWNVSMLWMTFFGFAWITGRLSAVLDQRSTESRQDALTELLNLRGFEERVQVECERAERYRTRLVVAFLDLDGFKFVNDSAGHAAGDRLLREVAEHLRRATRACDLVARVGGDEFCIAFPETDRASAYVALERIRGTIEQLRLARAFGVTVSIGVAETSVSTGSLAELLRQADRAMYTAKRSGKNLVRYADTEASDDTRDEVHPACQRA